MSRCVCDIIYILKKETLMLDEANQAKALEDKLEREQLYTKLNDLKEEIALAKNTSCTLVKALSSQAMDIRIKLTKIHERERLRRLQCQTSGTGHVWHIPNLHKQYEKVCLHCTEYQESWK